MRRAASAVAIAIGVAAVCTGLAGCTAPKPEPVPPAPTLLVASTPSPSHPSTVPLGTVNFSGTGSETLTVRVPNGSAYLNSNWECSSDGTVTLVEDPGVFEGGSCGGDSGYQMPLPPRVAVVHFTIAVDAGTTWTFGGYFT
ncbi:hypothetical protein [Humibacter ginsengiterrae]